jgi:signal transduction histidine kinase
MGIPFGRLYHVAAHAVKRFIHVVLKKIINRSVFWAMSIATLLLLCVQFYWLHDAYESKKHFHRMQLREHLLWAAAKHEKSQIYAHINLDSLLEEFGIEKPEKERTLYSVKALVPKRIKDVNAWQYKIRELPNRTDSLYSLSLGMHQDIFDKQRMTYRLQPIQQTEGQDQANLYHAIAGYLLESHISFINKASSFKIDIFSLQEYVQKDFSYNFHWDIYDPLADKFWFDFKETALNKEFLSKMVSVPLFNSVYDVAPYHLVAWFSEEEEQALGQIKSMFLSSVLLIFFIGLCAYYSLSHLVDLKLQGRMRNDFINNMTHELKTPIATVSLACQGLLAKDIVLNEAQRNRYVGIIEQENQRLLNLVENVLQANSLSKGKLILDKKPINLVGIIQNVVESSVLRVDAKKGTIEFLYNPKEFYTFVADKIHLTNAIYNLLDNAIKYSQGNLQIKVLLSKLKNGYMLHIQDNGIGIDRIYHKKIFEKLYRVPTGNIHETTGYGLGLSYVKYIVDMHQGKIWLDSELNKGTKFFVRLYN